MTLVARASNTVRNKNLLIVGMCAVFFGWFAYDGFIGWPAANDRYVASVLRTKLEKLEIDLKYAPVIKDWKTWNEESADTRDAMSRTIKELAATKSISTEGWKDPFDVNLQRWIVLGLAGALGSSLWWFIHCQRRRCIAEEATVSPAPGVVIPWDKIKVVDNTRWKTTGIVDITYTDESGQEMKAKFDDYELDREPLLGILDQLAEKAVNAEFIPKEEPKAGNPEEPPAQG